MAAPPKYQKVNDIESDEDSYADNMPSILKASQDAYPSRDLGQKAWFRRPSVSITTMVLLASRLTV